MVAMVPLRFWSYIPKFVSSELFKDWGPNRRCIKRCTLVIGLHSATTRLMERPSIAERPRTVYSLDTRTSCSVSQCLHISAGFNKSTLCVHCGTTNPVAFLYYVPASTHIITALVTFCASILTFLFLTIKTLTFPSLCVAILCHYLERPLIFTSKSYNDDGIGCFNWQILEFGLQPPHTAFHYSLAAYLKHL